MVIEMWEERRHELIHSSAGLTWFYSRQPHTRCPPPTEPHKYPWLSGLFSGRVPLPLSTSHPQIHRRTHTHHMHTVREITGKKKLVSWRCGFPLFFHCRSTFLSFWLNPEQYEASSSLTTHFTVKPFLLTRNHKYNRCCCRLRCSEAAWVGAGAQQELDWSIKQLYSLKI